MGSVGGTLVLWAVMGLYTVGQALCYAELGTVIPKAGGDYTYVYTIFGEVPGFLVVYAHIFLAVASAVGAIALTAAVYILQPLGMDCQTYIIIPMGIFMIGKLLQYFQGRIHAGWGAPGARPLTRALDPSQLGLCCTARLCCTSSAKMDKKIWGPLNQIRDPPLVSLHEVGTRKIVSNKYKTLNIYEPITCRDPI